MNTTIIRYTTTTTIFFSLARSKHAKNIYIDILCKINSYEIHKNTFENTNSHKVL